MTLNLLTTVMHTNNKCLEEHLPDEDTSQRHVVHFVHYVSYKLIATNP